MIDRELVHPHARLILANVPRFNAGDTAWVQEMFAGNAVWHAAGRNRYSGPYRGPEAIGRWFAAMVDLDAKVEPIDIMADDDHMSFLLHIWTDDRRLDQFHVNLWRMRDGKCSEGWFLPDDRDAWDAFTGERL